MTDFRAGLVFSLITHLVVGVISVLGIPALKRDLRLPPSPVPIEFVAIDDVTRVVEDPTPPQQQQEETQAQPQTPSVREEQVRATDTGAVPTPDAEPRQTDPDEGERRPMPRAVPRTKPRPPSALDTDRLAALIDRSKEDQQTQQATPEVDDQQLEDAVERARQNQLQARIATATLVDAIRQRVETCWNVPAGARDAHDLVIRIDIYLRMDGSLLRPPEFVDRGRLSDPFYRAAAESAARAIRQCAPYDLPAELYNTWRYLRMNFDPSNLLGG